MNKYVYIYVTMFPYPTFSKVYCVLISVPYRICVPQLCPCLIDNETKINQIKGVRRFLSHSFHMIL